MFPNKNWTLGGVKIVLRKAVVPCQNKIILKNKTLKFFKIILFSHGTTA